MNYDCMRSYDKEARGDRTIFKDIDVSDPNAENHFKAYLVSRGMDVKYKRPDELGCYMMQD